MDTEGFVLRAKVHVAKTWWTTKGSRRCYGEPTSDSPACVTCGWTRATGDKGADWVEKALGWSVDLVERPRKPAPEEVLMRWAREWAKEGVALDWHKLLLPKGFLVLPRRWVVERTIAWIEQNRRMSKDYENLCASGEAFVYAAMRFAS